MNPTWSAYLAAIFTAYLNNDPTTIKEVINSPLAGDVFYPADVLEFQFWHSGKTQWGKASNDLKLSDCGARRGSCVVRRSEDIRASVKGGSEETGPS